MIDIAKHLQKLYPQNELTKSKQVAQKCFLGFEAWK